MTTVRKNDSYKLVSPEASIPIASGEVNPHLGDLAGKTVVLYWNGKPNGDILLSRIGELLTEKVNDIEVIKAWQQKPATRHSEPNLAASRTTAESLVALKPDMVIGGPGDCAGCVTWLVKDQLNLERLGIPTVTVIASPFQELAHATVLAEGFQAACFVEVPPPIGMLAASDIDLKAESIFEDIVKASTQWQPPGPAGNQIASFPAEVFDFSGTIEDINNYFLKMKWSLGLPIVPPSPERLDRMLTGTRRKPEEVLGQVPPQMGALTIELAAVFAVMAGCRPSHMPLLIAALEAFLDPQANLRLALSGTGTSQLIVVVNGPVVNSLGVGCAQGAAGKGQQVNGAIGYAINLIAYAAGGSRPPAMDRSTLASPSDYVCWVFGENEDALPHNWMPLHTERGFEPSDSVVTVMASYPPVENNDHWSESVEEHLHWWRHIASPMLNMGGPGVPQVLELSPIIALGPEHAQLIASQNWGKDDFLKAFWDQTRIPFSAWPSACDREGLVERMGPIDDETLIPITLTWDRFQIVIAGGDGKQSHFFAPLPGAFPVSRLVEF